jgi:hypothetical protein
MIRMNDDIIDRFQADQDQWQHDIPIRTSSTNVFKIEHYGKNYHTDSSPDKYFELTKCFLNGVDLKHHLHRFRQTAFLPPWDRVSPPEHSLYLGHNGYLMLQFASPVNAWIQGLFGIDSNTMHGQSTTRDVLDDVKRFFQL